jgi:hypothetical protein
MDNKDLEDTRALNDLKDLVTKDQPIIALPDDINDEDTKSSDLYNNLIAKEDPDSVAVKDDQEADKSSNKDITTKFTFKEKWHKLPKKKKIIIIIVSIIAVILLIGAIYLLCFKSKKNNVETTPDVILAKDNYIYQNGTLSFKDSTDNIIGTYECKHQDENLCYVAYVNNDEDPFETAVNEYQDNSIIKTRAKIYLNKYVFIVDEDSNMQDIISLYNMQTNEVMGEYLGLKQYNTDNENLVVLKNKSNEYGLFELTANELKPIVNFKYSYMGIIPNNDQSKLVVKTNKGYCLIDYNSKTLTKIVSDPIVDYNDTYLLVKNNDKYSVYDYDGQEYNKDYDYIRLINDNLVAVVSNKMVYIKGINDSKYNEVGYRLSNTNYATVNTYDSDNKLISSSYAFKIMVNNNILTITIHNDGATDEDDLVNLNEGNTSSKYNYYNYFDGVLYFYDDDAKTNLIGSYQCNNKNSIDDSLTLNNCYIAKDTVLNDTYINPKITRDATIPIYNKHYIFIYDSPTLVNDTNIEVKFYDLTQSKVLGTYALIDSNTPNNNGTSSLITTDNTTIIAKLKTGKFGTINITNSGASVGYKFNYNYLEKYGNYYEAENNENKWEILYSQDSVSSGYPGKILNNVEVSSNEGYFVIQNGEYVNIYKSDGSILLNDGFKYIELLSSKVFGAVDVNNKLYIYTYLGEKLNDEGIKLNTTDYFNTKLPAFKLAIAGENVKVSVLNNDTYTDQLIPLKKVVVTNGTD